MIKKILVGIDTSEHSRNAQAYGFYLAGKLSASLIGLHCVDIVSIEGSVFHDISGSLGLEPYMDFSTRMREVLVQRGETVLGEFAEEAKRRGVPVETMLEMGVVANQICAHARAADLAVIGHRGTNDRFSTALLGSTVESVARKCPRPLFIAPIGFREISRPVLAYDGSERASHAMRAAAEFASGFHVPLTVVTIARDPRTGERTLDEARSYFESNDPPVQFKLLCGHANEELIKFAGDYGADCLFVGAYGHSRIIAMVIGSTTEYVLRNSPCPVFLSR